MTELIPQQPSPAGPGFERVYPAKGNALLWALLSFAGGGGLLLLSAIMLLVSIFRAQTPSTKPEPLFDATFVSMIGSAVLASFAIMTGIAMLRTTRRVVVTPEHLRIETSLSRRTLGWSEVRSVIRGNRSLGNSGATLSSLELLDAAGRTRAVITDTLADFESLAQQVIALSTAANGSSTYDPTRDEVHRITKETRSRRLVTVLFLFFTLGMAAALVYGIYEEVHLRRLAREGVGVEGKVLRTWMVSVTPRVEFSFKDAEGRTFTREAVMYAGDEWKKVQASQTVRVVYLPSDPEWNRLVSGEDPGAQFGGTFLLVSGGGVILFGGFLVICLLGYDLKTENGQTVLTQRGRVIRRWGTAVPPRL